MDASLERLGLVVVAAALGCAAGFAMGRFAPVADATAEPQTGPDKNPRLAAAGRLGIAAAGLNSRRFTCEECGHGPTTAGPLGVHHKASGHRGRVKA